MSTLIKSLSLILMLDSDSSPLSGQIHSWRVDLVNGVLRAMYLVGILAVLAGAASAISKGRWWGAALYVVVYIIVVVMARWQQLPYPIKAGGIVAILYGLSLYNLFTNGIAGDSELFILACVAMAVLLFGWGRGALVLGLAFVTFLVFAVLYATHILAIPANQLITTNQSLFPWISSAAVLLMMGCLLGLSQNYLLKRLLDALSQQREYAGQSQSARQELEKQVAIETEQRQRLEDANREVAQQTESLRDVLERIREASHSLAGAAEQILAASTQQRLTAIEESAAIQEILMSVDEVKQIAEQATQRAQEVAAASQRTVQVSRAGIHSVQTSIDTMGHIRDRVASILENITALAEQTRQVGNVIATVDDLATQSHLVALNAAIEAARAGEQGRGFAVVAQEVQNLAARSRQATAYIQTILSQVQNAADAAMAATEEGARNVGQGVELADQARQAIEQLTTVIAESAQAADQMVAGSRQQSSGMDQIAQAIHLIDQSVTHSTAGAQQTERSAQGLNALAHNLQEIVNGQGDGTENPKP